MSTGSPQWRAKASGFFSSSGVKLKQAGQSAGTFVGEVAKDASENVVEVAEQVGSLWKRRWSLIQQSRQQQALRDSNTMQERFLSAAASTGTLLKKGISGTKEKVSVGKVKVEEAAKKTAHKSKSILTNIERWQKGVASTDLFGAPIEITVQRQQSSRPIPQILVKCADNLVLSGLHSEYLFKSEGDRRVVRQLTSLYNQDWNAALPDGVSPVDVAALAKCYLISLPEPLTTFELYHEIRDARSSIEDMRNALKRLSNVNYMTLEFVTALLLCVSQKSSLNRMDARSLAIELVPAIIWQKGDERPDFTGQFNTRNPMYTYSAWDSLSDKSSSEEKGAGPELKNSTDHELKCLIKKRKEKREPQYLVQSPGGVPKFCFLMLESAYPLCREREALFARKRILRHGSK